MGAETEFFFLPTKLTGQPPANNWKHFKQQQQQFNPPSKKDRGAKPNKKR